MIPVEYMRALVWVALAVAMCGVTLAVTVRSLWATALWVVVGSIGVCGALATTRDAQATIRTQRAEILELERDVITSYFACAADREAAELCQCRT